MGARVAIYNRRSIGGEPAGDVQVRASELVGATVTPAEVPALVDELPLLALAACHARGETVVRGAAELRVKESRPDRGGGRGASPASERTFVRRPTASGSAVSPPASAAARSTRAAITGWRCSARSAGCVLPSSGVAAPGCRGGRDELPGLLRMSSTQLEHRYESRHDRGDRRPGRLREEHGRARARAPARLRPPRHRGHVPGADLARCQGRRRSRGRRGARPSRARASDHVQPRGPRRDRGRGRLQRHPGRARSTGSCPSSPGIRRCAR